METVVLQSLSKTYSGGKLAVRQVSLSLNQGEVFGFLGPNGAGKTTTVKLLNGMLSPTEGSCQVLGVNPAKEPEKVHRVSGVLTEHAQMYDNMTGTQNLIFYASLFDIPSREARSRTESLLKRLGLENAGAKKLSAYSTGMRQRLSLWDAGHCAAATDGPTESRRGVICAGMINTDSLSDGAEILLRKLLLATFLRS